MKEYPDPLGRPIRRLYLRTDVLDKRCEGIIREFMDRRSGGYRLPIPTDELIRLLEERAGEVDTYASLPEGIHGQTTLFYHRKPIVKIAESIYKTRSDHRVRTTACHEFGHVWLHGPLWREAGAKRAAGAGPVWNCYRENIISAPESDWTEWQAGWVSGAILMPASALRAWAAACAEKFGAKLPFPSKSPAGMELIKLVTERCDVSISAAKVRLSKLRPIIEDSSPAPDLKEKRGITEATAARAAVKTRRQAPGGSVMRGPLPLKNLTGSHLWRDERSRFVAPQFCLGKAAEFVRSMSDRSGSEADCSACAVPIVQ